MRLLNRTAISIVGAEPYVEWTRRTASTVSRDALVVGRAKPFGTAVLLPELELEEDVLEWVEDNFAWLFELQLSAWTDDESAWPPTRDLKAFREWFRVDIHNTVVDVDDTDIEGEEL